MFAELETRDRKDLLTFGWAFAALVFDKSDDDMQWLQERFDKMSNILKSSWVYQKILEEGLEKGRQQLRQRLVHLVQKQFPVLAPLAQEQSVLIEDMEVLGSIIDAIIDAETIEDARRILEEPVEWSIGNLIRPERGKSARLISLRTMCFVCCARFHQDC
jgi:predicted transposase YdaD